jgi:hypothetical protein
MKKFVFGAAIFIGLLSGCTKTELTEVENSVNENPVGRRSCASHEVLQEQLRTNPALRARMDAIENHTRNFMPADNILVNGEIHIPVVVNVLYKTAAQNISLAQIQSQIDVLNADFNNLNSDKNKVPSAFLGSVGNSGIKFDLHSVVRKATNKKSWGTNDAMKKSSLGGIDPTNPELYLNMWVCNLGQGLLGYAQFPGGNPATDGIVVLYSAFGSKAVYPGGSYISRYDLGRTATHEVGHWMNLYHIWGDDGGSCSGTDRVTDTPNQGSENYGCPAFPHVSCSNGTAGDMFMNYMDYTDDRCMFMFTNGQVQRIQAVFSSAGPRAAIGR